MPYVKRTRLSRTLVLDGDLDLNGAIDVSGLAALTTGTLGGDAITKIKTGTYTGDGTTSKAITGVGFTPKMVIIFLHAAAGNAAYPFIKFTDVVTDGALKMQEDAGMQITANTIISLDADGFTVDDAGADDHPNTNLSVYDYICLG